MSQTDRTGYASFRSRFRAFVLDGVICMAFFFVGGIAAGAVFENHPAGRIMMLFLLVVIVLSYEPVLVANFGATLGHQHENIHVVDSRSGRRLSLFRAYLRNFVKVALGIFSFTFMFVTKRAQGLHDLAGGSQVLVRNPRIASANDYFVVTLPAPGTVASPLRRTLFIVLYCLLLLIVSGVLNVLVISNDCLIHEQCTSEDKRAESILSIVWLIAIASTITLGWTGRLPGCRARKA